MCVTDDQSSVISDFQIPSATLTLKLEPWRQQPDRAKMERTFPRIQLRRAQSYHNEADVVTFGIEKTKMASLRLRLCV